MKTSQGQLITTLLFPAPHMHHDIRANLDTGVIGIVTGMGTDPDSSTHWAREKGRTEREMAALARGTGLRTFSYRSAFIRPTTETANALDYVLEALLRPGKLVITARNLGASLLFDRWR